jgi:hypothetical protein
MAIMNWRFMTLFFIVTILGLMLGMSEDVAAFSVARPRRTLGNKFIKRNEIKQQTVEENEALQAPISEADKLAVIETTRKDLSRLKRSLAEQQRQATEELLESLDISLKKRRLVPKKHANVYELMQSLGISKSGVNQRRAAEVEPPVDEKHAKLLAEVSALVNPSHMKRDKSSQSTLTADELFSLLGKNRRDTTKRFDVSSITSPEQLLDLLENNQSGNRRGSGKRPRRSLRINREQLSAKEFDEHLAKTSRKMLRKRDSDDNFTSWWGNLFENAKDIWTPAPPRREKSQQQKGLANVSSSSPQPLRATAAALTTSNLNATKSATASRKSSFASRRKGQGFRLSNATTAAAQDAALPSTPPLNMISLPELDTNEKGTM